MVYSKCRKPLVRVIALLFVGLFVSSIVNAQASKKRKGTPAQRLQVIKIESPVYKARTFDAPIVHVFKLNEVVIGTKKKLVGMGGFGLFYKVRYGKGKYGYVADTDLKPYSKKAQSNREKEDEEEDRDAGDIFAAPDDESREDVENMEAMETSLYYQKFIGLVLGFTNYTEKFDNKERSSNLTMIGVKTSGYGALFDGPPLDASLSFALEAPSFYKTDVTQGEGFVINADLQLPFPVFEIGNDTLIYLAAGAAFVYSNFTVDVERGTNDVVQVSSEEFRAGLVGTLGIGQRILQKYAIRAETRYYYETYSYAAGVISVQFRY